MSRPIALLRVLIAALSFASLLVSLVPPAAAQAGVNGRNATAVDIGQSGKKLGEYRQTGPKQWAEMNAAGAVAFRFEETNRDEWSVYPSVADVEPTGVLAVVNSFNKPICR